MIKLIMRKNAWKKLVLMILILEIVIKKTNIRNKNTNKEDYFETERTCKTLMYWKK